MNHGTARLHPTRGGVGPDQRDRRHREPPVRSPRHGVSLRLVFATVMTFAVITALAAVVATLTAMVRNTNTLPERSPPRPPLFESPVAAGLPPPGPSARVPVNPVDRFTGNPITATSPTIQYRGYVVAFGCPHSASHRGGWDRLSEAARDTYVRGFLE